MPKPHIPGSIPGCAYCTHSNDNGTCDAFPDRIPFAIASGEFPHDRPYPGDRGIRFNPVPQPEFSDDEIALLARSDLL